MHSPLLQPQISVPDVIIWMMSGDKRLASARLPAHQLMYIPQEQWKGCLPGQGHLCGKAQSIMLTVRMLYCIYVLYHVPYKTGSLYWCCFWYMLTSHECVHMVCVSLQSPSLKTTDDPSELDARAKLHLVLWLGMASDVEHANVWSSDIVSVQPAVYAETVRVLFNTHTCMHTRTHTHTLTQTHARTHTHSHKHTHTHSESQPLC